MAAVACVNPLDVDSVVIPIGPEELEKMPSYLICELANSLQLVKDVSGACCLVRMGFRLYAHINEEKKTELCSYLCRQGLTVLPHSSPHCLVQGKITCGLRILGRGIRHCRNPVILLVAYGMKVPFPDMCVFSLIQPSLCSLLSQFDLGRY